MLNNVLPPPLSFFFPFSLIIILQSINCLFGQIKLGVFLISSNFEIVSPEADADQALLQLPSEVVELFSCWERQVLCSSHQHQGCPDAPSLAPLGTLSWLSQVSERPGFGVVGKAHHRWRCAHCFPAGQRCSQSLLGHRHCSRHRRTERLRVTRFLSSDEL